MEACIFVFWRDIMNSELNYKQGTRFYLFMATLFITVSVVADLFFRKMLEYHTVGKMAPTVFLSEGVIFIPLLIYLVSKKVNLKKVFRFNKISLKQLALCFVLFLCSEFVSMFIQNTVMLILKFFNMTYKAQAIPDPHNGKELLILIILVAVIPAFCEDCFFRGFLLTCFQKKGLKYAAVCSGFAFALLHFNAYIFFGIFYLGIILALSVYYTNSIWAGIFIHFCNNSFSCILKFIYTKALGLNANKIIANSQKTITPNMLAMQLVYLGVIAAGAIIVTYFVLEKLRKMWIENGGLQREAEIVEEKFPLSKIFNVDIVTVIIIYIIFTMFLGYIIRFFMKLG